MKDRRRITIFVANIILPYCKYWLELYYFWLYIKIAFEVVLDLFSLQIYIFSYHTFIAQKIHPSWWSKCTFKHTHTYVEGDYLSQLIMRDHTQVTWHTCLVVKLMHIKINTKIWNTSNTSSVVLHLVTIHVVGGVPNITGNVTSLFCD